MTDIWREKMIERKICFFILISYEWGIIWTMIDLTSYHFFPSYIGHYETCNFIFKSAISPVRKIKIIHVNSEMESWKVALFMVFSYLKNNKKSRSYRCINIAKNRFFRTFRLGLLEDLMWWRNSEPGLGFYAKNYFWNNYRYFYNKHNLIFCRPVLLYISQNILCWIKSNNTLVGTYIGLL